MCSLFSSENEFDKIFMQGLFENQRFRKKIMNDNNEITHCVREDS